MLRQQEEKQRREKDRASFAYIRFLSHSPTAGCLVPLETEMLDSSQDFCLLSYPQDKQWKLYADALMLPQVIEYISVLPPCKALQSL